MQICIIISDDDSFFELGVNHLRELCGLIKFSISDYFPETKVITLKDLGILDN
jgi:hypothetical protein